MSARRFPFGQPPASPRAPALVVKTEPLPRVLASVAKTQPLARPTMPVITYKQAGATMPFRRRPEIEAIPSAHAAPAPVRRPLFVFGVEGRRLLLAIALINAALLVLLLLHR